MKSKWVKTFTSAACILQLQLFGWGTASNPQITINQESNGPPYYSTPSLNFPFNEDQEWLTKGSLLVWKPYEDDVDTGTRIHANTPNTLSNSLKMKHPSYDWSTGVRLEIGKYLPQHEWWDLFATMTYYYNQGKSHTSPTPSDINTFEPGWDGSVFGAALKSTAHTQLNLYIWDLGIGRNYALTSKIVFHPFFGARGVLIDQKYSLHNNSGFLDPITSPKRDIFFKTSFKANQKFYGVGARIGTDLFFHFAHHWSLIGNFSSSFIWARYKLHEKISGMSTQFKGFNRWNLRARDAADGLRTNLEGAVGLGWETWVNKNSVRIAPSILFEVSEWYAVNHWFSAVLASPPSVNGQGSVITDRHYGDLGFRGTTLNVQFDY